MISYHGFLNIPLPACMLRDHDTWNSPAEYEHIMHEDSKIYVTVIFDTSKLPFEGSRFTCADDAVADHIAAVATARYT